jgi:hypothetical protein
MLGADAKGKEPPSGIIIFFHPYLLQLSHKKGIYRHKSLTHDDDGGDV